MPAAIALEVAAALLLIRLGVSVEDDVFHGVYIYGVYIYVWPFQRHLLAIDAPGAWYYV